MATFTDLKNDRLLAFFGLPANVPYTGHLDFAGSQSGTAPYNGGAFDTTVFQGGVLSNTPIPEPATLLLLGSWFVALVFARRKRAI
jgi:hypothetical protein